MPNQALNALAIARWDVPPAAGPPLMQRYKPKSSLTTMEGDMIKGSCLCGAIVYEVEPIPEKIYNCHCSQCRKSHGAAFATQALAKGSTLRFLKGKELLKEYTGHGGVRAFCSNCGSRLMNYAPDKSLYLSVALSSVDSDYDGKPIAHANVDSKASWYSPPNDIPSYPGMPDGALD